MHSDQIASVEAAWNDRAAIDFSTPGVTRSSVGKASALLDSGGLRKAMPSGSEL